MKKRGLWTIRTLWLWGALASSALANQGNPAAITYVDAAGKQRIYCFVSGNNSHLRVNYWDGVSWNWADQGLPAGATSVAGLSATTYVDSAGKDRIYVFATANPSGHLVVNYFDGFSWHWADQGLPAGAASVGGPSTITYVDKAGNRRIYVFTSSTNGHLYVNHWDGFSWHWADQGFPGNGGQLNAPSAITWVDPAGNRQIYVFAALITGALVVNYWDGFSWHWADHGFPAGTSGLSQPTAITYVDTAGKRRIYVFARTSNGPLVVNYFDGASWHWAKQGLPVGSTNVLNPEAITWLDAAGNRKIYVFATGSAGGGDLVVNYWNGSSWHWADLGLSASGTTATMPQPITYLDSANVRWIYVFVRTNLFWGDLAMNYWDGFTWQWADQGSL